MRKLLVGVLIVAGFPLAAGAQECTSGAIEWVNADTAWWGGGTEESAVRTAIVGTFLWVEVDGVLGGAEIPSTATAATACVDGTVTFAHAAPVVHEPVVVVERFIEPLSFGIH